MMCMKGRLLTPVTALTLDDLVPADHFYRHLDRVLDLTFVRDLVYSCYVADKGRPSVDPVVFFRLQLVMFFEGIRSERQLLRLAEPKQIHLGVGKRADRACLVGWVGWMEVLGNARGVCINGFLTRVIQQVRRSAYHM